MVNLGIIGYGIVGQATSLGFKERDQTIAITHYDTDQERSSHTLEELVSSSEFIFLCLPTPYTNEGIDLTILDKTVEAITPLTDNTGKIIITKSTAEPGTTRRYSQQYPNSNFCFNPEFLREKHWREDAINPDRIVVGADRDDIMDRVVGLYARTFRGVPIYVSGSGEAELAKYMTNIFLATKVTLANAFYEIADHMGLNYTRVRELVTSDGRVGSSHLEVPGHDGKKGFGMKCFPKDLMAIIGLCRKLGINPKVLQAVWDENLRYREERDWDNIPYVTTRN